MAGLRPAGTLLGGSSLHGETVVLDDVAVIVEGVLNDDFLVDLNAHSELWVPLVAQGVGKVALQVYTIQSVR